MNLQPAQWEIVLFRHGLPHDLRFATWPHFLLFRSSDDSSPAPFRDIPHKKVLIDDLKVAPKHSRVAERPQETTMDEAIAESSVMSERQTDDSMTGRDPSLWTEDGEPAAGPPSVIIQLPGTNKRRRGNPPEHEDDTTTSTKGELIAIQSKPNQASSADRAGYIIFNRLRTTTKN